MKKLVRKIMFVLSFLGLFAFSAPKQAKAESGPDMAPPQYCADYECENGFSGTLCGPDAATVLLKILEICGASVSECER